MYNCRRQTNLCSLGGRPAANSPLCAARWRGRCQPQPDERGARDRGEPELVCPERFSPPTILQPPAAPARLVRRPCACPSAHPAPPPANGHLPGAGRPAGRRVQSPGQSPGRRISLKPPSCSASQSETCRTRGRSRASVSGCHATPAARVEFVVRKPRLDLECGSSSIGFGVRQ